MYLCCVCVCLCRRQGNRMGQNTHALEWTFVGSGLNVWRSFCIVLSSIIHLYIYASNQTPQRNGIETKQFHITYGHIIHHCQCQKRRVERRARRVAVYKRRTWKKNKSRKATKLTPVYPSILCHMGIERCKHNALCLHSIISRKMWVFVRMVSKWAWVGSMQCNINISNHTTE